MRFTGQAYKAFVDVHGGGLSVYYFEDSGWADIHTGSAASAFVCIYFYLNQIDHPEFFDEMAISKIKALWKRRINTSKNLLIKASFKSTDFFFSF